MGCKGMGVRESGHGNLWFGFQVFGPRGRFLHGHYLYIYGSGLLGLGFRQGSVAITLRVQAFWEYPKPETRGRDGCCSLNWNSNQTGVW